MRYKKLIKDLNDKYSFWKLLLKYVDQLTGIIFSMKMEKSMKLFSEPNIIWKKIQLAFSNWCIFRNNQHKIGFRDIYFFSDIPSNTLIGKHGMDDPSLMGCIYNDMS